MLDRVMSPEGEAELSDPLYLVDSHCRYEINQIKDCMIGRVLTIIDACIDDGERRKAIKDLIKKSIWEKEYFSEEISEILIQFTEKFTNVKTDILKKRVRYNETPVSKDWFAIN